MHHSFTGGVNKDDETEGRNHLYTKPITKTNNNMEFQFNFNIKPPKRNKSTQHVNKSEYTIIDRHVNGVCYVDINGTFCCIVDSKMYNFTKRSFKVFNGVLYTTQLVDNKMITAIKLKNIPEGGYSKVYMMPFMAGVICIGNLVRNNSTYEIMFDFKKSLINWKSDIAKRYFLFYKNNYKTIMDKFIEEENDRVSGINY